MKIIKILLGIILAFVVVIVLIVAAVFGMRWYNTEKWGWGETEEMALHDYDSYPDSFEGGTVEHFESGAANGFHLLPDDPVDADPIVTFGGSEGSSNFDLAVELAEEGYEVYSLFFFGADNQTEALNGVPLELFGDFLEYADLRGEDVAVLGASKGAEIGLVLTNYYEEISNIILYAPSSYVFMGLDFTEAAGASWSWEGTDLEYIDITNSDFGAFIRSMFDSVVLNPVKYRETYESAVEMADNREEARIDTSNFDGQALLFAGRDDAMWQGDIAAEEIGEALGDNAEVIIYDGAGHLFGAPPNLAGFAMGGTLDANMEAKEDSDERLYQFLEENVQR